MKFLGIHGASSSGKDTAADFIITSFGGQKVSLADPLKHFCRDVFRFTQTQLWGASEHRNGSDPRFCGDRRPTSCTEARQLLLYHGPLWLQQILPHAGTALRVSALVSLRAWLEDCLRQEGLTPRYALQTLGTEWGRSLDPDIWLKYADYDAAKRSVQGYCVIPDVRFVNEAAFITMRGGHLLAIHRPGFDGGAAMAAGVAAHRSETDRVKHADDFHQHVTHTIHNDSTLDVFKERLWCVVSPESVWPGKPHTPSPMEPTSSTITVSDTDTDDSSPSTSSITGLSTTLSPLSTDIDSNALPQTPTDKPKTFFETGPKVTFRKNGGSGPKTGRKS